MRIYRVNVALILMLSLSLESHDAPAAPASPASQPADAAWSSPNSIDAAVDKGAAYLLAHRIGDIWDPPAKPGEAVNLSHTALVTFALMNAGRSVTDSTIKPALTALSKAKPADTFTAGFRAEMMSWMDGWPERTVGRIADEEISTAALRPDAPGPGLFGPALNDKEFQYATSYIGLNGIHARQLSATGKQVPQVFWAAVQKTWRDSQSLDGGWGPPGASGTEYRNTAAGLLSLQLATSHVNSQGPFDQCHGNVFDPHMDAGMKWLDAHFPQVLQDLTEGKLENPCEATFWAQRIGHAFGRQRIGGKLWQPEIAQWLLRTQLPNGSWGGDINETAYAIMFLGNSEWPAPFNKLIYPPGHDNAAWNERPNDLANLVPWMNYSLCSVETTWHAVAVDDPLNDFCSAPILYISGNEPIEFDEGQLAKLRQYVESGGLILGNADCGCTRFSSGFRTLGNRLFPNYSFRDLPPDHLVFNLQFSARKWKTLPKVQGMSNGVRELMILVPEADLGRAWQLQQRKTRPDLFQLTSNIHIYAAGRNIGQVFAKPAITRFPEVDPKIHPTQTLRIARLEIGENWNPEPAGWPQLSAILHNQRHVDVNIQNIKLGAGKLAGYSIAHLTGTTQIALGDPERKELKEFVEKGGTLIIDAAGGSVEFAESAEAEVKAIFGDAAAGQLATPLPGTHALYAGLWTDRPLRFRSFARSKLEGSFRQPRIRAIAMPDGHIGVFFSREDLIAGMAFVQADGILGYEPQTALTLMERLVLYSSKPH